jgi:hypothetical protein
LYTHHTPFTDIREGTRDEDEHSENANDRETQRVPGDPVPIHGTREARFCVYSSLSLFFSLSLIIIFGKNEPFYRTFLFSQSVLFFFFLFSSRIDRTGFEGKMHFVSFLR